jgi:nitronate monooxygenase
MRTLYALRSLRQLKQASLRGLSYRDFWQAGKSAGTIDEVVPAGEIVRRFRDAAAGRTVA